METVSLVHLCNFLLLALLSHRILFPSIYLQGISNAPKILLFTLQLALIFLPISSTLPFDQYLKNLFAI